MLIKNGRILHYNRFEANSDMRVENDRITAIGQGMMPEPGEQVVDAAGNYVLAGLIDLHHHGIRHVLAQNDSLLEYSQLLLEVGVTACVATLSGTPEDNIQAMQRGLQETRAVPAGTERNRLPSRDQLYCQDWGWLSQLAEGHHGRDDGSRL